MVTADIFVTHVVFQVLRRLFSMGPVFSHTLRSITMVRQRMAIASPSGGGVHPGCPSKRPWRLKLEALLEGCGTPAEWRSGYRVGLVYPNVRESRPRPAISFNLGRQEHEADE